MSATHQPREMDSRVSVLEHGFSRLEHKVDSGMAELGHKLDKVISNGGGQRPNLYASIGLVVAVVSIIGAIFSLAEWRVGVASDPLKVTLDDMRRQLRDGNEKLIQLRVDIAREQVIRELLSKKVP